MVNPLHPRDRIVLFLQKTFRRLHVFLEENVYYIFCRWHLQSFVYTFSLTKNIQLLKGQHKVLIPWMRSSSQKAREIKLILLWKITQSLLSFLALRASGRLCRSFLSDVRIWLRWKWNCKQRNHLQLYLLQLSQSKFYFGHRRSCFLSDIGNDMVT